MKQIYAILASSYYEARAQRSFLVLAILGLPVILFCFGLSIRSPSPEESLPATFSDVSERFQRYSLGDAPETTIVSVASVASHQEHAFAPEFDAGHVVILEVEDPVEFRDYAISRLREHEDSLDTRDASVRFLENHGRRAGFDSIEAVPDMDRPNRFYVAAHSSNPATLSGSTQVSLLFGAWKVPVPGDSAASFITKTQGLIANAFTGLLGLLVMLAATSGFIPNLLKRGTVDLMLARPIGRTKLLLSKYLGGLWFVVIVSTLILGGCWLGFAFNGFTAPAFLISIPVLIYQFAVLYTVSTLIGLLTRNGGLAFLASIGIWFFSTMAYGMLSAVHTTQGTEYFNLPPALHTAIQSAYNVLPKIKEIDTLTVHWIAQAQGAEGQIGELQLADQPDPLWVFGTTTAFAAVCLALAARRFYKRDG